MYIYLRKLYIHLYIYKCMSGGMSSLYIVFQILINIIKWYKKLASDKYFIN